MLKVERAVAEAELVEYLRGWGLKVLLCNNIQSNMIHRSFHMIVS
jgi:hypothetical protein